MTLSSAAKWGGLVMACLVILSLGSLLLAVNAEEKDRCATWQRSASAHVRIGVRNKYGNLGKYSVEFIVTGPDNRQYRTTRIVKGDEWGYVFFPDDFNGWWSRGNKYAWTCRLQGRVIAQGTFEHEYISADAERITVR